MAKILVIDDEEPIRKLLRATLEAASYTVLEASNGREGLELCRNHSVDLVITDIAMPEMNGLDFILELTLGLLNVKVIAMSGEREKADTLNIARLLGARQTLQKPLSLEQLLNVVRYELAH